MGRPRAPNGQNSKNFVFGRRDFIFTQYVPLYVRKSSNQKIVVLGPYGVPPGPKWSKFQKFCFWS